MSWGRRDDARALDEGQRAEIPLGLGELGNVENVAFAEEELLAKKAVLRLDVNAVGETIEPSLGRFIGRENVVAFDPDDPDAHRPGAFPNAVRDQSGPEQQVEHGLILVREPGRSRHAILTKIGRETNEGSAPPETRAPVVFFVAALSRGSMASQQARKPAGASLEVSPRKVVLYGLAHPKEVVVRVLDGKGREIPDQLLVWTSSDPNIADGSGAGHVAARKPGRVNLTVSVGKVSRTVPVDVVDLGEIIVNPSSLKLFGPPGTSARLEVVGKSTTGSPVEVPAVAWSAENPKTREGSAPTAPSAADGNGKTMVPPGFRDLLPTGVQSRTRTITRLELRPETAILKVSESQRFTAVAYDDKGLLIPDAGAQFTSLNPDLVKISGDGKATAVAKGTATVSAALGGKTAQATVLIN